MQEQGIGAGGEHEAKKKQKIHATVHVRIKEYLRMEQAKEERRPWRRAR